MLQKVAIGVKYLCIKDIIINFVLDLCATAWKSVANVSTFRTIFPVVVCGRILWKHFFTG